MRCIGGCGTFDFTWKIRRQRLSDRSLDFGHHVVPPPARIAGERLVERGWMTETGYDFGENGVRDGLAVGDDTVEVENQCAH